MKATEIIRLEPGQTMAQYRRAHRLEDNAAAIVRLLKSEPGLESKAAIAERLGLPLGAVKEALNKCLNEHGSAFVPVGYGVVNDVVGWYVVNIKAHHGVMDQQDEHLSRVELGVRRRRLVNIELTELMVRRSEATVASMMQRLGIDTETLTITDVETLDALCAEEEPASA